MELLFVWVYLFMARHIDVRSPSVAKILWGNNSACFEEPTLEKEPCQVISASCCHKLGTIQKQFWFT